MPLQLVWNDIRKERADVVVTPASRKARVGSGLDEILHQAAEDIGIAADRAVNFVADSAGIAASFEGVSQAVGNLRARRRFEENADGTSWRARMDRDFNGRRT